MAKKGYGIVRQVQCPDVRHITGMIVQTIAVHLLGEGGEDVEVLQSQFELGTLTKTEVYTLEDIIGNIGGFIERPLFRYFGRYGQNKGHWDIRARLMLPDAQALFEHLETLHKLTINEWQGGKYDKENLMLSRFPARKYFVALVMAINVSLAIIIKKHKLPAGSKIGFLEGLRREVEILETLVPNSNWAREGRAMVAEAFSQEWLDTEARFAPIKLRAAAATMPSHDTGSVVPAGQRYDIERLLTHMKTDGYIRLRALPNRNYAEYSALTFDAARADVAVVLMDTPKVGNALYYYVGPLETLMMLLLPLGDNFARAEALKPFERGRTIHLGDWETRCRERIAALRKPT